jgi:hypothetical protein
MFPYLSIYIPWLAMISAEIALFVLLKKESRNGKGYRGFEAYITSCVVVSLLLLMFSFTWHGTYYTYVYFLGAFIKVFALAAAVIEQFKIQFFPKWSMSSRSFRVLMGALVAIGIGSVAVVAFTPQETPYWDLGWARRIVSLSDYLLCGSMGLLLIYGEFLKVQRPQRANAIVRGFIAMGILGITSSLMLSVSGTSKLDTVVGFSTTIGFLAILASWIVAFAKPEAVEVVRSQNSPLDFLDEQTTQTPAMANEMLSWKV